MAAAAGPAGASGAGGGARRLGGLDKTGEVVGGRTLLARVLGAVAGAQRVIVVGGSPSAGRGVLRMAEDRPGGGPAHALAAAGPRLGAPRVVLLAADLPFVTMAAVRQLLGGLAGCGPVVEAVVAVDDRGRDQYLLAAWDATALRRVLATAGDTYGRPLGRLYGQVRLSRQTLDGFPPPWWDCDTAEALATARAWSEPGRTDGPGREGNAG